MSRGTIEIPIEVWEGCERDAERIAFLHKQYANLAAEYVELKDLYLKCRIDIGNLHKENERLTAEVEWLRKADRLVCWNPTTQEWEVRHESPK